MPPPPPPPPPGPPSPPFVDYYIAPSKDPHESKYVAASAQQARVSNWVSQTSAQAHSYSNPFVSSSILRDHSFYEPDGSWQHPPPSRSKTLNMPPARQEEPHTPHPSLMCLLFPNHEASSLTVRELERPRLDKSPTHASSRPSGSKRPDFHLNDATSTLGRSTYERKSNDVEPIKEKVDTIDRLEDIRKLMAKDKLDYYVVPSEDPHQSEYVAASDERMSWISGFTGSAGQAIVSKTAAYLVTDSRYWLQARDELDSNWHLIAAGAVDGPKDWIDWLVDRAKDSRIGIDARMISHEKAILLNTQLKHKNTKLVYPSTNFIDMVWKEKPLRSKEPVFIQSFEFTGREAGTKIAEVRAWIQAQPPAVPAYSKATRSPTPAQMHVGTLITSLSSIAWLLNLRGSDIPFDPLFFAYLFISLDRVVLFLDSVKLTDEVKDRLRALNIERKEYNDIWTFLRRREWGEGKLLISPETSYAVSLMLSHFRYTVVPSFIDNIETIEKLRRQYVSPFEVEDCIQRAIHAHLENAPLRLLNTSTGCLCDRQAQINAFKGSTEYKELLSSSMKHPHIRTEPIKEAVIKYFQWAMLSHRWENKEPLLHDIQDKVVYDLDPVGTMAKLQTFCKVARDAGYCWAWSDTCCIDQNNNVELQRSVNSMFIWYRRSALTIVYLSDVPPSAKSGALARSVWNTRGWTVQEFLAPTVVLFYQADWTLYLNDHSPNHKDSSTIMQELEHATGINAQALVAFRPGMSGAREKLRWASMRTTTLQEDIAYSLFGIFGIHLPVIYGETKQNALGRLLQEIVAQSGDITALDWAGKSSEFNSCLPADITSYKPPPCMLPYPSEDQMQMSISSLRNTAVIELASTLYTRLDNLTAPRFANRRLLLPCITFPVTELRRRRGQNRETCFTYDVKADGLDDLLITTEDKLIQFSPARPTQQTFLFVRPWNRYDLGLPDFADDARSVGNWSESEFLSNNSFGGYPGEDGPVDGESHLRELRLIVRLGQPFGALLLAQQRGGEYKRIASNRNIIAKVRHLASVHDMMDVRILEIL